MAGSPMIDQYKEIKANYTDCILMFRLGDFYEMFFEDAETASRELELALTGRNCGANERAPMCGVPFHSAEGYITRLISKGYKVAICEQLEDPKATKGIVKRDVVRVITPGTVTEGGFLKDTKNNYLCSIYFESGKVGIAFADISTGELSATDYTGSNTDDFITAEGAAFSPAELIVSEKLSESTREYFTSKFKSLITESKNDFDNDKTMAALYRRFPEISEQSSVAVKAVAGLMSYLIRTQKQDMSYMNKLNFYDKEAFLQMDANTRRSLEISESMRTGDKKGSLLWAIDKTSTAMGARLLKKFLDKPSMNCSVIQKRLEGVRELVASDITRRELSSELKNIVDIERLMTRLVFGSANARDLRALESALRSLPDIKSGIENFKSPLISEIYENLDTLGDICTLIDQNIAEKPPFSLREGEIIKDGSNADVDELREIIRDGKGWISKIEAKEKERTGIRTLKVGYNKVFGYYIEVSNSFLNMVPDDYIRRQTLTNGERFITEQLKDMEGRVLSAKDRDAALEYEIFSKIRTVILDQSGRIQKTCDNLAILDVICSFAKCAVENNYVEPEVDYSGVLHIENGRHPVVEAARKDTYFVPNDCNLTSASRLAIITGPNMAGKSTYMRQNALIIILAQIGSFVPATKARIGVADKIFARVGASDDLASGNSTFMVEMNEVSYILKNATERSFIIYDEIGRGTSTYDGMSIARAVAEYTVKNIKAKTLFATHYHELTDMEALVDGVINLNVAAKKKDDSIQFLRKIVKGPTASSYGIEVGSLAGLPKEVINSAKKHLKAAEGTRVAIPVPKTEEANYSFDSLSNDEIVSKLKATDINTLTPIEAIGLVYELKKIADAE
ncbi:MAG: DNA mismatch repair protein MutS [Ruminococcaceae bacterium]|nr:DNA mismatch repair protein MutS [Oscillospiraceae bacterium]